MTLPATIVTTQSPASQVKRGVWGAVFWTSSLRRSAAFRVEHTNEKARRTRYFVRASTRCTAAARRSSFGGVIDSLENGA